jgi:hypothetical protein
LFDGPREQSAKAKAAIVLANANLVVVRRLRSSFTMLLTALVDRRLVTIYRCIRTSHYRQSECRRRLSVPVLSMKQDVEAGHRLVSEATQGEAREHYNLGTPPKTALSAVNVTT